MLTGILSRRSRKQTTRRTRGTLAEVRNAASQSLQVVPAPQLTASPPALPISHDASPACCAETRSAIAACARRRSIESARSRALFRVVRGQWGTNIMGRLCAKRVACDGRRVNLRRATGMAAVLVAVCGMGAGASADHVHVIAKSGDVAPGCGPNVMFNQFASFAGSVAPVIGPGGHVAFQTTLTGSGVGGTSSRALFRSAVSGNSLVARMGASAPGVANATFYSFGVPMLNEVGDIAYPAVLSGVTSNGQGYWGFEATGPNALTGNSVLIAREADLAPGLGSAQILGMYDPVMRRTRDLSQPQHPDFCFTSSVVSSTGSTRAFWEDNGPTTSMVARSGDSAFGVSGAVFSDPQRVIGPGTASVVYSTLFGSGVGASNNKGIWLANRSSLALVARTGDPAVGAPAGMTFSSLYTAGCKPILNSTDDVAFEATYADASGQYGSGVWVRRGGASTCVARTGMAVSGLDGVMIASVTGFSTQSLWLTDDGRVVFLANLGGQGVTTENDRAMLIASRTSAPTVILRAGDALPGYPGVQIARYSIGNVTLVNGRGDVAALMQLQGDRVTASNDKAFVIVRGGVPRVVAREGEEIIRSRGQWLQGLDADPSYQFNNLGQLVFSAWVSDTSAGNNYIATMLRVDESNSLCVLARLGQAIVDDRGTPYQLGITWMAGSNSLSANGHAAFAAATNTPGVAHVLLDVTITPPIRADLNASGRVTIEDLFKFLQLHFAGRLDYNADGLIDSGDIFSFLADFFSGE